MVVKVAVAGLGLGCRSGCGCGCGCGCGSDIGNGRGIAPTTSAALRRTNNKIILCIRPGSNFESLLQGIFLHKRQGAGK